MTESYDFAISVGSLISAASYLDTNNDPQQLVAPADGSSWLSNDILLEPDCGAAEFSAQATFVDFNAYVGNVDSHMLALSDFPTRAMRAIPMRDNLGFGTLASQADEDDFEIMVDLVRTTDLAEAGLPSQWNLQQRHEIARLLHLSVLFRAFRSIARRNLLRPCNSAVIAVPLYLWGAAAAAAELVGISEFFLVDPNVAAIAANRHRQARIPNNVTPKMSMSELTRKTTLVLEIKYNCTAVTCLVAHDGKGWEAKRLTFDSGGTNPRHPDEAGDIPSYLTTSIRNEVQRLLPDTPDIEPDIRHVLRRLRGRVDSGAYVEAPMQIPVLGERRPGFVDVGRLLDASANAGYASTRSLEVALAAERLHLSVVQEIVFTGPLRNVADGKSSSPQVVALDWLEKQAPSLSSGAGGARGFSKGGPPSLGAATLTGLSQQELEQFLSNNLGMPHEFKTAGRKPHVQATRPDHTIITAVKAMMTAVGDVHFSTGGRAAP